MSSEHNFLFTYLNILAESHIEEKQRLFLHLKKYVKHIIAQKWRDCKRMHLRKFNSEPNVLQKQTKLHYLIHEQTFLLYKNVSSSGTVLYCTVHVMA